MSTQHIPRNIPNPLQRDGTNQHARLLEALKPDSVKIDGKDVGVWLQYAHQYAELLKFHNLNNVLEGDWTDFFERDISALIAFMGEKAPLDIRKEFIAKLNTFAEGDKTGNEILTAEIIAFLQAYADRINQWLVQSSHTFKEVPELLIHTELNRLIPSVIDEGYSKLLAYLKRAQQLEISFRGIEDGLFHIHLLEAQWPLNPILGKFEPLANGIPETAQDIETEAKLLQPLFNRFYEVHLSLFQQVDTLLDNSLEAFPAHQPHIALFLACLKVFETNQEHLNTLTKSHLDFYYEEVLKLQHAPEIADKVHLVFELAQNFFEQKIEEDRRFIAGTDDIGEDLYYASDAEIVVNRAQVDEEIGLKSLHIQKVESGEFEDDVINIFAAIDSDSQDGLGEELLSEDGQWETFGTSDLERTPHGEVGFAIASPMFLLGEGERKVTLTFQMDKLMPVFEKYGISNVKSELENNVTVEMTGEKGWVLIEKKIVTTRSNEELELPEGVEASNNLGEIVFELEIPFELPSISAYDEKTHQANFATSFPVTRFIFDNFGLSTSGDLDLNLKRGVEEYNSNEQYLPNEIVQTSFSRPDGFKVFYRSLAGSIGISPEVESAVWELIDLDETIGYSDISVSQPANCEPPLDTTPNGDQITICEGAIVEFTNSDGELCLYYANGDFPDASTLTTGNPILPDTIEPDSDPESPILLWKEIAETTQEESEYNPEENYSDGDIVFVDRVNTGGVFLGRAPEIYSVAPGSTRLGSSPPALKWESILEFSNSPSTTIIYNSSNPFTRLNTVVFQLNVPELEVPPGGVDPAFQPGTSESIWEEISVLIANTSGDFKYESVNRYDVFDQVYRLDGTDVKTSYDPTGSPPISPWKPILAFAPSPSDGPYEEGVYVYLPPILPDTHPVSFVRKAAYSLPPQSTDSKYSSLFDPANTPRAFTKIITSPSNKVDLDGANMPTNTLTGIVIYSYAWGEETVGGPKHFFYRFEDTDSPSDFEPLSFIEVEDPATTTMTKDYDIVNSSRIINFHDMVTKVSDTEYFVAMITIDVDSDIDPAFPPILWTPEAGLIDFNADPNRTFEQDDKVFYEDSGVYTYYIALGKSSGWTPNQNFWSGPVPVVSDSLNSYGVGSIVKDTGGNYFEANINNTVFNPDGSNLVWIEVTALSYDFQERYGPLQPVIYNSAYYFNTEELELIDIGPVLLPGIDPNLLPWGLLENEVSQYDPLRIYAENDYVLANNRLFQARVKMTEKNPLAELPVWEKMDVPELEDGATSTFDENTEYDYGDLVYEDETLFRSKGNRVSGIRPEVPVNLEFWRLISFFNLEKAIGSNPYGNGDIVRYQKGVFSKGNDNSNTLDPGQTNSDWTLIQPIQEYQSDSSYPVSRLVVFEEKVYQAVQNVPVETPPDTVALIWQELDFIQGYSDTEVYEAGDYVQFSGQSYRALGMLEGAASAPDKDPESWHLVGNILEFNESIEQRLFENMHIRHPDGRVMLALTDTIVTEESDLLNRIVFRVVPSSYPYKYFKSPELNKLLVSVKVEGIKNLILENDNGIINAGKPFNPFGTNTSKGSRFYIGSYEIFQKPLETLTFNINWGELPDENFGNYYKFYDENFGTNCNSAKFQGLNNDSFTVEPYILEDGEWKGRIFNQSPLQIAPDEKRGSDGGILLFLSDDPDTDAPEADRADQVEKFLRPEDEPTQNGIHLLINNSLFKDLPNLEEFQAFSPSLPRGFIALELKQDFFDEIYPKILTKGALQEKPDCVPNSPYIPLINSFSVSYSASKILLFKNKQSQNLEGLPESFFHIHPFGQSSFLPVIEKSETGPITSPILAPKFEVPDIGLDGVVNEIDGEPVMVDPAGTLFIGLKEAKPLETVNILFQVAESSENPDRDRERVIWSYLAHNRWVDFPAGAVANDTTNGLLTSGIIQFSLPRKIVTDNTILPKELFWIKASVAKHHDSVAKLIVVKAQAVQASYRNSGNNDPAHPASPLEADTISQLEERLASISKISQPFASFDGKVAEQELEFYTRVSERLRHKGRGINIFDIERLVLQQFPEIFKVKCVNHSTECNAIKVGEERCVLYTREHAPGKVKVVVLPNLRNRNAVDPLRPRASQNTLFEIEKFLKKRMSDFVDLEVGNALFEEIKVNCTVVFHPGRDKAFYEKQLNEDLIRFLSPWLFDEGADLPFGGSFHHSLILDYMDRLDYVDYILDLTIDHTISFKNNDDQIVVKCLQGLEEVVPTTACSVLVSENQHNITVLTEDQLPCPPEAGEADEACIRFP